MNLFNILKSQTYKKAKEIWGVELQIDVLIEELGELIVAISHYKRGRGNKEEILEEIVDVTIMNEQIRYMLKLSDCKFNTIMTEKLERTFRKLKEIENSYEKRHNNSNGES